MTSKALTLVHDEDEWPENLESISWTSACKNCINKAEGKSLQIVINATEKKGIAILHTICFMRERLDYKNIFMHGEKNIKIDISNGVKR